MEEKDVRRPTSGSQEVPEEEETGEMKPIVGDGNENETDGEQASSSHHVPDIPVIQAPSAPVTVLSLPEEVMELVFKKFSLADLNSCNAVCKTFKTWQDSNIIWHKKLVEKGHDAEAIDYIQNTRLQLVGEDFNTHPLYQSPCLWKYTYIKMNILRYNWENNVSRNLIFSINFNLSLVFVSDIKINGDLLLVPDNEHDACSVYNTQNEPLFAGSLQCGLRNETMTLYIHKNLIIIVQLILLSVFRMDENGRIELQYRRLLTRKEDEVIVPPDPVLNEWFEDFRKDMGFVEICFSNNYLVCCEHRLENITLYTWEISQGIQVHVQDGLQPRGGNGNPIINERSIIELIPPAATHSDEIIVQISNLDTHTFNVYNFLKPDYRHVLKLELYITEVIFESSRLLVLSLLTQTENVLKIFDCSINAQPNTLLGEMFNGGRFGYPEIKVKGDILAFWFSRVFSVFNCNSLVVPIYNVYLEEDKIDFMFSNWDYILVVIPKNNTLENTTIQLHDYRKNVMSDISQTNLFNGGLIPINSPTKFFIFQYEADDFVRKINMVQFW